MQGALLLVAAIVVAVVLPQLRVDRVAGAAVTAPILGAPDVGACILQDPTHAPTGVYGVAAPSYGSCSAAHFGEVIQIFTDSSTFPRVQIGRASVPNPVICNPAASSYLAVDQVTPRNDRGDYRSVSFAPWLPISTGSVGLIVPSAVQRAAGQHWIACVTRASISRSFRGTVRDAYLGGELPDAYATCADELPPTTTKIDCATTHQVEIFASTTRSNDLPDQANLTSSCSDFLQYVTGRIDLSAGGRLAIRAISVRTKAGGDPDGAQAFCGISTTGRTRLTGTLFGVGGRPLPLS